jgi:hypothetical protein
MKSRPILFSGAMVRAIQAGTKTQTRRIVTERHIPEVANRVTGTLHKVKPLTHECPYGYPGDTLWVRETWAIRKLQAGCWIEYKADSSNARVTHADAERLALPADTWRPSIFMPRWACRLEVQIVGIRVERLQDISEADAQAEGVASVAAYAALWDSLNAKRGYGWAVNPWVWVVEFQR